MIDYYICEKSDQVCELIRKGEKEAALAFLIDQLERGWYFQKWNSILCAAAQSGDTVFWHRIFGRLPLRNRVAIDSDVAMAAIQSGELRMVLDIRQDFSPWEFGTDWGTHALVAARSGSVPVWEAIYKMAKEATGITPRFWGYILEAATKSRPMWGAVRKVIPSTEAVDWNKVALAAAIGGDFSIWEEVLQMAEGKVTNWFECGRFAAIHANQRIWQDAVPRGVHDASSYAGEAAFSGNLAMWQLVLSWSRDECVDWNDVAARAIRSNSIEMWKAVAAAAPAGALVPEPDEDDWDDHPHGWIDLAYMASEEMKNPALAAAVEETRSACAE